MPPAPSLAPDAPVAIVLLSGGLDSATCLALARREGFACVALSLRYGQRHAVELDAARAIATAAGVEHVVLDIDLATVGGSALTDAIEVPKHEDVADVAADIPVTYVPARNTVFLSLGLALAEVRGARDLFIGVNALDYSGYPDCRPAFLEAFQRLADLATRAGVDAAARGERWLTVHAPLLTLTKAEIVRLGAELGVDHAVTVSCYDPAPDGACGRCDACLLRRRGFAEAGLVDPTRYAGEDPWATS